MNYVSYTKVMKLTPIQTPDSLKRLVAAQTLLRKTEGGIQFKGGLDRFEVFSASVSETIQWPAEWTPQEITNCVRGAIVETVRSGKLEWSDFCEALDNEAHTLFSAPFNQYAMWTKVNAAPSDAFRSITFKYDGVKIRFAGAAFKKLRFTEIEASGTGRVQSSYPEGGMVITAQGRFRSVLQAGEALFNSIQDICGLINLAEHRHRRTYRFGEAKPKATLLTAKYHFLFCEGVSTHEKGLFYNADFREDFWRATPFSSPKILQSAPFVRRIIKDLEESTSSERIRASIRLLHEGWQSHNLNQRVLWAWTAFETLLSRSVQFSDDYNTIKNRALFIAKNPDLERMALDLAITYRNRFVHQNRQGGAAESAAEYLDEYLITIIEWILQQSIRFESHGRFLDMLDVSRDQSKVRSQIADRRRALRARGTR